MRALILLAAAAAASGGEPMALPDILSRVSEEAEVFRQIAPQILAQESLHQRALKSASRFHPRVGGDAAQTPHPQYQEREIISEYSYSSLQESPGVIHEFRQVISVDGRPINTPEKARHALGMGLKSEDDRARKRMLEDFQKHGLSGAAMDLGQLILLFTKRRLHNYDFRITGSEFVGGDEATVLAYEQREGPEDLLVFEGRNTVRARIKGQLWTRQSDGLPLRISMRSEWKEQKQTRRHEAVVEYALTPFGALAPASVKHSERFNDLLVTENLFRYSSFKKFGSDAEIKFDTLPPPVKP